MLSGNAIAFEVETKFVPNRTAFTAVHAHMVGTGANIHLEFTFDTNETLWTHTVFKVIIVRLVEMLSVDSKLLQKLNILCSLATNTVVIALEIALVISEVLVLELTDWSDKTFDTGASQMTVDRAEKQKLAMFRMQSEYE
jgi:hypothetical protein